MVSRNIYYCGLNCVAFLRKLSQTACKVLSEIISHDSQTDTFIAAHWFDELKGQKNVFVFSLLEIKRHY